jgi:hypothetical protein
MVILAAAAITAAGVGAYQGGKAAVTDVGKKMRRKKAAKDHQAVTEELKQQRTDERLEQEQRRAAMSTSDRLARFKSSIPNGIGSRMSSQRSGGSISSGSGSQTERKGLFGRNK